MNTLQIEKILRSCDPVDPYFLGCVPADLIPLSDRYPYAIVVNTDASSRPGQHWVALYASSEDLIEYFDSYGDTPNENILSYIERFPNCKRSTHPIQSPFSKVCGQFCITYLVMRCSGMSFERIVARLGALHKPDVFVNEFVQGLFV